MWRVWVILGVLLVLPSCALKKCKEARNPVHKGVIFRYDKLLDDYVRYNSFSALQRLNGEYRMHTRILTEKVLKAGSFEDDDYHLKLKAIYSDSILSGLAGDVFPRYDDLQEQEKQFTRIFNRLENVLPGVKIPQLYAQISGLNQSVVVSDSLVGISLDNYLGSDYPLYERYFPIYQRASMRPERMASDVVRFYLMSVYPFPEQEAPTLLNRMIYLGKIYYVTMDLAKPSPPENVLDYTGEEHRWCEEHGEEAWEYMRAQGHLQSTDPGIHSKYLDAAECTEPFGMQSPHRLGIWMGIQIMASYLETHPETKYHALFTNTPCAKCLAGSGFPGAGLL